MPLELHNTLTGRREAFVPADPAKVTFYTCGPTVYDYAHIGNFRAFLVADLLRRWIESPLCEISTAGGGVHKEPREVVHVMNMTDVGHMTDDAAADGGGEDKMEAASRRLLEAKKSGRLPADAPASFDPTNPYDIAEYYAHVFLADAETLGLKVVAEAKRDPSLMPRPTKMIAEMLALIGALIDKGFAYAVGPPGAQTVYFDVQKFPDYGRLSGNTLEKLRTGAGGRVSESNQAAKKHPADFMLWKSDATHTMRWPSPWGQGYPGWHIECSAMALGRLCGWSPAHAAHANTSPPLIDLHSGGEDNIFPHHECEIAQSRAATGQPAFARCWVHTRFLFVEGEKMSKSKGNFYTVGDLVSKGFDPAAIRLELIKTHYRTNANFTEQGLKDSTRMVERWRRFLDLADASTEAGAPNRDAADAFAAAMHDDLNIAGAIGGLNSWIGRVDKPTRADAVLLRRLDESLGVLTLKPAAPTRPESAAGEGEAAKVDSLIAARNAARKTKNFAEADRIRAELTAMGVEITDTPTGTTWARKATL